jgi:tetratricopeptide (TPR) repeat protein
MSLDLPDRRHLEAAEGWLGLGDWNSAGDELKLISPGMQTHPDVLRVRWDVCARSGDWETALEVGREISKAAPTLAFGWIQTAFALHELKRTTKARETLIGVLALFKRDWNVHYNLACYDAQLGNLDEAMGWLERALILNPNARALALEDEDLKPVWARITSGF